MMSNEQGAMWAYQQSAGYESGTDLAGFKVEATDGHIGKIDKHSDDLGAGYIVVDTGPWIFGKYVMLPAGTISEVDVEGKTVRVDRTKEEIKNAPEFDVDRHPGDSVYRDKIGGYYGMPRTF